MADAYLSQFPNVVRDRPIVTEAGTSRTLSASDYGRTIMCTSGSSVTITVPPNLPVNFNCKVVQVGDGTVTLAEGVGVTIISLGGSLVLAGKGATATLTIYDTDEALLGS